MLAFVVSSMLAVSASLTVGQIVDPLGNGNDPKVLVTVVVVVAVVRLLI